MTEKEKKRLEMYEQRYAESWKKREINEEGTLKPFSKEELEHIFMLNDHLKELTSSTIDKTLRVSIHLLDEIEKGYKDFEDYQIESYIGMTYLDDGDETLEEQIRLTFEMAKCDIIGWGADLEPGVQEDDAFDKEMIFNNEEIASDNSGMKFGRNIMFRSTGLSAIISTISPSSRWKTS